MKFISKGELPGQQRRAPSVKVAGVARCAACWRPIAFPIVLAMAAPVVHGGSPLGTITICVAGNSLHVFYVK